MASHSREYMERQVRPPLPVVTKWLLILNVGIFLIDMFGKKEGVLYGPLTQFGAFTVNSGLKEGRVWELITFQFLHASVGHVLFNSIGIYFFGPFVERWLGTRKFLIYYLICGVAGALFFTLLLLLNLMPTASMMTPLVGASAGLFGLLAAVYVLAPTVQVQLLFPPITLTMRQFAIGLTAIAVGTVLGGLLFPESKWFWNSGGEAGHLGGLIAGVIMMKNPWLLGIGSRPKSKIVRPKEFRRKGEPKLRPRSRIDPQAVSEVDRILDKVGAEGFGSLSEAERAVLEEASKKDS